MISLPTLCFVCYEPAAEVRIEEPMVAACEKHRHLLNDEHAVERSEIIARRRKAYEKEKLNDWLARRKKLVKGDLPEAIVSGEMTYEEYLKGDFDQNAYFKDIREGVKSMYRDVIGEMNQLRLGPDGESAYVKVPLYEQEPLGACYICRKPASSRRFTAGYTIDLCKEHKDVSEKQVFFNAAMNITENHGSALDFKIDEYREQQEKKSVNEQEMSEYIKKTSINPVQEFAYIDWNDFKGMVFYVSMLNKEDIGVHQVIDEALEQIVAFMGRKNWRVVARFEHKGMTRVWLQREWKLQGEWTW